MEIILLEKIRNLGNLGETVNVKPGYGRNFLIPTGKAIFATEANIKMFEAKRAELEKAAAQSVAAAQARAAKIVALGVITLSAQASEEGKLFGSITVRDIADAITAAGVEVAKNEVSMPEGSIHAVGEYEIDVLLHSDVTTTVKVVVNAE